MINFRDKDENVIYFIYLFFQIYFFVKHFFLINF